MYTVAHTVVTSYPRCDRSNGRWCFVFARRASKQGVRPTRSRIASIARQMRSPWCALLLLSLLGCQAAKKTKQKSHHSQKDEVGGKLEVLMETLAEHHPESAARLRLLGAKHGRIVINTELLLVKDAKRTQAAFSLPMSSMITEDSLRRDKLSHFLDSPDFIKRAAKEKLGAPRSFIFALFFLWQQYADGQPHALPLWRAWVAYHLAARTGLDALYFWSDEELELLEEKRLKDDAITYRDAVSQRRPRPAAEPPACPSLPSSPGPANLAGQRSVRAAAAASRARVPQLLPGGASGDSGGPRRLRAGRGRRNIAGGHRRRLRRACTHANPAAPPLCWLRDARGRERECRPSRRQLLTPDLRALRHHVGRRAEGGQRADHRLARRKPHARLQRQPAPQHRCRRQPVVAPRRLQIRPTPAGRTPLSSGVSSHAPLPSAGYLWDEKAAAAIPLRMYPSKDRDSDSQELRDDLFEQTSLNHTQAYPYP